MGHLGYQNIIRLLKVTYGIDVKRLIPREIYGDCIKEGQQKTLSYEPMSQLTEY